MSSPQINLYPVLSKPWFYSWNPVDNVFYQEIYCVSKFEDCELPEFLHCTRLFSYHSLDWEYETKWFPRLINEKLFVSDIYKGPIYMHALTVV